MGDTERSDWMAEHLATYLASRGAEGHVVDIRQAGGREFTTHCLLRCVGRTSGVARVRPLIYGNWGGEIVVVASKGGADTHPDWYLNLVASETVDVQVATQAFEATWREPEQEERHDVWSFMSHLYPPYVTYQRSTSRHIPVVMLTAGRSIEPFTSA